MTESGLATCQCDLTEASHKPIRNKPLFSFDRCKSYHPERLSDLCKVTQLVSNRARIYNRVCLTPHLLFMLPA